MSARRDDAVGRHARAYLAAVSRRHRGHAVRWNGRGPGQHLRTGSVPVVAGSVSVVYWVPGPFPGPTPRPAGHASLPASPAVTGASEPIAGLSKELTAVPRDVNCRRQVGMPIHYRPRSDNYWMSLECFCVQSIPAFQACCGYRGGRGCRPGGGRYLDRALDLGQRLRAPGGDSWKTRASARAAATRGIGDPRAGCAECHGYRPDPADFLRAGGAGIGAACAFAVDPRELAVVGRDRRVHAGYRIRPEHPG